MQLSSLAEKHPPLKNAIEKLQSDGLHELYPPQRAAVEAGVLEGENLLLCSGTGSGKTLIAIFAILKAIAAGKKAVYLAPLKALASEKHREFLDFGIDAALSLGDLDSSDGRLGSHDCIVMTTEKFDSLFRHRVPWIRSIGVAVIDEIHEIGSDRGPTLETVIIKLKKSVTPQIVALSATVGNAKEISDWLNSKLVKSDFRPIPLHEGIFFDGKIHFSDEKIELGKGDSEKEVVKNTLEEGFQSLMFVNTRREAMASAEKMIPVTLKFSEELDEISEVVLNVLSHPTEQCKRLAKCVKRGCAFHHAGLASKQRHLVENAFREGKLKHISATVTLVAGVNLPSHRIIIRNLVRFTQKGMRDWPVSLYKQAVGRAGRPGYDTFGESVILSDKSKAELQKEKYIDGLPEPIYSQLAAAPVLRSQILGAIASLFVSSQKDLFDFFESSFFSFQYGDKKTFRSLLLSVIDDLEGWGFVRNYNATKIGSRVAELYLDPLTASWFLERLEETPTSSFGYIHALSHTLEMRPLPYIRKAEWEELHTIISRREDFLEPVPGHWDSDYEEFMRAVKLALVLEEWIEEAGEDAILKNHNIAPGDLRRRLLRIDWLAYSFQELARLSGKEMILPGLKRLRFRLKYGVKEELARLVEIKHIGRVRARKLYRNGIKTPAELRKNREKASKIVGKKIVDLIFSSMPSV